MAKAEFPYDSVPTLKSGVNNNPNFQVGEVENSKIGFSHEAV
jgi:hypothetical protein